MVDCKRILIIKWGALGDLIAGTTAIKAIRIAYPNSSITLLSNKMMFDISPPGYYINNVVEYNPHCISLKYTLKLLGKLKAEKFDTAINLRWNSERSALICWLSGAKNRVGSGPESMRFLYNIKAPLYTSRRHEFDRHFDIVSALGIPTSEPEPYVFIDDLSKDLANIFFQQHNLSKTNTMVIHPGASTLTKAWPVERFAEIGKRFIQLLNGKVLITWGPEEEHLALCLAGMIGEGAIVSPRTTIGMWAALVSLAGMCLANYSGAMNIAMAVKTPLVAIGCTSPEDWGPYGNLHRTISSIDTDDVYNDQQRIEAMKKIAVDDVWNLVCQRWLELYKDVGVN